MSIGTTIRPEVEEPRSVIATLAARTDLRPHVRQATAEITARLCATLPLAAVLTAATGMATGAFILLRHAVGHGHRR
jgi:hypothetical protein